MPLPAAADDPDLLKNRSLGDRTAVISAGVLANMALAFAICLVQVGGRLGGRVDWLGGWAGGWAGACMLSQQQMLAAAALASAPPPRAPGIQPCPRP